MSKRLSLVHAIHNLVAMFDLVAYALNTLIYLNFLLDTTNSGIENFRLRVRKSVAFLISEGLRG